MKFFSNETSISESDIGCQILFSDQINKGYPFENKNTDDDEKYVLLQTTFPEDDFEGYHSYIEFSDFNKSGRLKKCKIDLYRNRILIDYKNEKIEILFDVNESKYQKMKKVIRVIADKKCKFKIHD